MVDVGIDIKNSICNTCKNLDDNKNCEIINFLVDSEFERWSELWPTDLNFEVQIKIKNCIGFEDNRDMLELEWEYPDLAKAQGEFIKLINSVKRLNKCKNVKKTLDKIIDKVINKRIKKSDENVQKK